MIDGQESRVKKYIEIAERIRGEILSGRYREGEKIPPIRRLSQLYGANPQTVNKATAYLASLGYLKPRQGSGSLVCLPGGERPARGIAMLIDRRRSRLLTDLDDVANYHGKDIYLTYLVEMSRRGLPSGFLVYDREAQSVPRDFFREAASVAGFVVQGLLPEAYLRALAEGNLPAVFINRPLPTQVRGRFGSVLIRNDQLPNLVNFFASLGHTRLLYLLSLEFEENEVFQERLEIVRKAAQAWSGTEELAVDVFRFLPDSPDSIRELRARREAGFTAGLGYNDASALGLYTLLHAMELQVPRDFSVAGFDDILASRLAVPPLTTIRVNRQELVLQAFEILDALLARPEPAAILRELPTELVIRKSAFSRR